jgi:hypothetical protein
MKKLLLLAGALLLTVTGFAQAPSKESIERLLVVTDSEKLVGSIFQQVDGMMKTSMDQAMRGRDLPPEAQQFADNFRAKMVAMMKEELSWDKMKALYVQVYSESFNQEEIDGLIAFYESKAGKAFVAKMPTVMQKTMMLTQQKMAPMMQKMQQSMREAMQEVQAMKEKKSDSLPAVAPVKTE